MENHRQGHLDHKMDPKYRVSIPVEWRPEKGETLRLQLSNRHGVPLIRVLTEEAFRERLQRIDASDLDVGEKDDMRSTLHMMCVNTKLNDQGKLLVPKEWSLKADLVADKEVKLVGRGPHFEIMSVENFNKVYEAEHQSMRNDKLRVF